MSTVKLQIIFVKKQKETRVRLTQGRGTTLSNRNSRLLCVFFSHWRRIIRVRRVIRLMIRVRYVRVRLNLPLNSQYSRSRSNSVSLGYLWFYEYFEKVYAL